MGHSFWEFVRADTIAKKIQETLMYILIQVQMNMAKYTKIYKKRHISSKICLMLGLKYSLNN